MKHVMAKIEFMGNDDYNYEGWKVCEVESLKEWKNQIKEEIKDTFENYDGMVYHSDNDGTPFDSEEELFDKITFTEITPEEFSTVIKLFGGSGGHTSLIAYTPQTPKKKNKP